MEHRNDAAELRRIFAELKRERHEAQRERLAGQAVQDCSLAIEFRKNHEATDPHRGCR